MEITLKHLYRYHEALLSWSISIQGVAHHLFLSSKVRYLLNSLSTDEPLPPVCTVRYSKVYAGPSRTKTGVAHGGCGFVS